MMLLITIFSVLLAAHLVYRERRRSHERVTALAEEIFGRAEAAATPGSDAELFAATPLVGSGAPRLTTVFALGVFVVGLAAVILVMLSAGRSSARAGVTSNTPVSRTTPAQARPPAPLELIGMTHERGADRFVVHGVVRNPSTGAEVDKLVAVVSVFGPGDAPIGREQAAIAEPILKPGADARFDVAVPVTDSIRRYRVSFRTEEGAVSHIDRRPVRTTAGKTP